MKKPRAERIKRGQRWRSKKGDVTLLVMQKHGSGWNVVNQYGTGHNMQEHTIKRFYLLIES